jgi:hypothetical protein
VLPTGVVAAVEEFDAEEEDCAGVEAPVEGGGVADVEGAEMFAAEVFAVVAFD